MLRRPLWTWLFVALLASACGTPPNKEMDQAQGAIDAARAAGADRYAAMEYEAAVESLSLANDAVAQRDYRLALNHALESREHAQNAAREAADTRARLRGEVERAMAEITVLLAQVDTRVKEAESVRSTRRAAAEARKALEAINADVQKAGAAIEADDYMTAQSALAEIKTRIDALMATLDTATSAQSSRRGR